jgi:hypothetical protein
VTNVTNSRQLYTYIIINLIKWLCKQIISRNIINSTCGLSKPYKSGSSTVECKSSRSRIVLTAEIASWLGHSQHDSWKKEFEANKMTDLKIVLVWDNESSIFALNSFFQKSCQEWPNRPAISAVDTILLLLYLHSTVELLTSKAWINHMYY